MSENLNSILKFLNTILKSTHIKIMPLNHIVDVIVLSFNSLITLHYSFVSNECHNTVEEIESKAKQIFADHVISNGQFALKKSEVEKKTNKIGFNFTEKSKKAEAYADLFGDK